MVERWSTRIKTVGYSFERREIGNRALAWRRVYLITVSPACNYWAILRMFTSTASSHSNRPSSSSSPSSSRVAWVFRCVIPHPFTWSRMIGFHRTRIHTHTHTCRSGLRDAGRRCTGALYVNQICRLSFYLPASINERLWSRSPVHARPLRPLNWAC